MGKKGNHACNRCRSLGGNYPRDCNPGEDGCHRCVVDHKMCSKRNKPGQPPKPGPNPTAEEQNIEPPSHAFRAGFEQGFQSGFRQALHLFMPGYSDQGHSDPGLELDLPSEHSEQSGNRVFLNSLLKLTQRMQSINKEGSEQQQKLQQIAPTQQTMPVNEQHRTYAFKRKLDDDLETYAMQPQPAKKTKHEDTFGRLSPIDLTSDHEVVPHYQQKHALVKGDDNDQKSLPAFRSLFNSGGFHTQFGSSINATSEGTEPPESHTGGQADNLALSGSGALPDPDVSNSKESAIDVDTAICLTHPATNYGEAEARVWNGDSSINDGDQKHGHQASFTIGSVVDPLRDPRIRSQVEAAQPTSSDTGREVDGAAGVRDNLPKPEPQD